MPLLDDKVAVIHGGGGSIGAATARAFAREGARVFLAGRSLPRLAATAEAVRAEGGAVEVAIVDAMDESAVEAHLDRVAAEAGRVDVALNAVGFDHVQGPPLVDTGVDEFLHPVDGYLRTNFVTARAAARRMIPQGSGVLLFVSTPGAKLSASGIAGNAAQSAALEGFARALAGELGPSGIRVVTVRSHALADAVDTSYTGEMFTRFAALGGASRDEFVDGMAASAPLGRLPRVAEVADYLAFAASDRAASMTGAIGNLTGGALVD
ncbi:SDR family NAD(P)-dependent oxidoreductase [Agromyces seonyuensis]|uniref:SDR family oxidoreductase n=1 Tax=Agromyces seonyuensis TaxID=2662446 RepID=A0A6I4P6X9_9MICO|nr:SDR family oxidoreductase [Agromyces seonyuensis]MWB99454.1 SDR family oxidoreductase [Agromyces seonyuensis]